MTITQFIERAIEGGWGSGLVPEHLRNATTIQLFMSDQPAQKSVMLLDAYAWKAVGKVEGWCKYAVCALDGESTCNRERHFAAYPGEYIYKMHRMIDALAEGKTIEQYLETL